jgi:hypothetical protein
VHLLASSAVWIHGTISKRIFALQTTFFARAPMTESTLNTNRCDSHWQNNPEIQLLFQHLCQDSDDGSSEFPTCFAKYKDIRTRIVQIEVVLTRLKMVPLRE